jgi:hypothetical protein
LAGAGLAVPGIFAGITASVSTAALGMNGMKDAFDAVTKASDGTQASVDAANKALAELSPNAAETVKTAVGLKGTFTDLRNIASENMFAGVSGGLKDLVGNLLPAATRGIDGISRGLNQNILQTFTSLGSGSSQGFLDRILGNTSDAQARVSAAIDPAIHAVGVLTAAGSDTLPRLADAVGKVADRFDAFITSADADGRLDKWISEGLDGFTHLGNILLNLGKSFTGITEAAGGGSGLLGTLEQATNKLQTFLNSTAGQERLKQFFVDGRVLLGQLMDIAVEAGPALAGVFNAGREAAGLWLPVIREGLSILNSIPGGAQAVVTAFVAWRSIQGVTSLIGNLNIINNLLGSGGKGGGGILGKLNGLLVGGGLVAGGLGALSDNPTSGTGALATIGGGALIGTQFGGAPGAVVGTVIGGATAMTPAIIGDFNKQAAARDALGRPLPGSAPGIPFDPSALLPGAGPTGGNPLDVIAPQTSGAGNGTSPWFSGFTPPPAAPLPGMAGSGGLVIPPVSSYVAPVVTQAAGGAPNLPYTGTANPNALVSAYSGGHVEDTHGSLVPDAAQAKGIIQQMFGITDIGGYRPPDGYNEHSSGEALDIMIGSNKALGEQVNQFLLQNADALGLQYTLFEQTQWNPNGTSSGMPDRGSPTENHMDHVHARFRPGPLANGGVSPLQSAYPSADSMGLTSSDLSLRNAQQRVNDTQHSEEQAQARLDELNAKGTANARQREAAEYALAKAKREHVDAIDALTVATDKYNKGQAAGKSGSSSGGEQLGQDFMSGLLEIFGLGDIFPDPTQFGLAKIFKGLMGLKSKDGGGQGSDGSLFSGGGGGGGLVDTLTGFIPKPFGDLNIGSPKDAPGQFMPAPGQGGGGGGGVVLPNPFASANDPSRVAGPGNYTPQPGVTIDMSGSSYGYSPGQVTDSVLHGATVATRQPLRSLPS